MTENTTTLYRKQPIGIKSFYDDVIMLDEGYKDKVNEWYNEATRLFYPQINTINTFLLASAFIAREKKITPLTNLLNQYISVYSRQRRPVTDQKHKDGILLDIIRYYRVITSR